jgi:hypothetical protein
MIKRLIHNPWHVIWIVFWLLSPQAGLCTAPSLCHDVNKVIDGKHAASIVLLWIQTLKPKKAFLCQGPCKASIAVPLVQNGERAL